MFCECKWRVIFHYQYYHASSLKSESHKGVLQCERNMFVTPWGRIYPKITKLPFCYLDECRRRCGCFLPVKLGTQDGIDWFHFYTNECVFTFEQLIHYNLQSRGSQFLSIWHAMYSSNGEYFQLPSCMLHKRCVTSFRDHSQFSNYALPPPSMLHFTWELNMTDEYCCACHLTVSNLLH